MSLDKLGLINLAALQLKVAPVTALTDTDIPLVNAANALYDVRRRAVLAGVTWNCARAYGAVTLKTDYTPPFDWGGAYDMPADLVALRQVGLASDQWLLANQYQFEMAQRMLFYGDSGSTPANSLYIVYTKDLQDVTLMDDLFIDAFTLDLAEYLAIPLTGDPKIWQLCHERAKAALAKALAKNRQERPIRIISRDPISDARNNYNDEITPTVVWPG